MKCVLIAVMAIFETGISYGAQDPIALPADSHLVEFTFDTSNTYPILTRPGSVTDIKLGSDEKLSVFVLGDTLQWTTAKAEGHVFIKPLRPQLITTATLVTDKRTYQLTMRSSETDGVFYQQISWRYPQMIALQEEKQEEVKQEAVRKAVAADNAYQQTVLSDDVDITSFNYKYEISGDAEFKPVQVFDDGKFTYIRLPKDSEMPAIFLYNEEDKAKELLNTHIKGEFVVIHRTMPMILLVLGEKQIKITNRKLVKRWYEQ